MRNDVTGEVAAVMVLTAVHFNTQKENRVRSKEILKRGKKFIVPMMERYGRLGSNQRI